MEQKKTFRLILAALCIMLVLLPFLTTFNSVLTETINRVGLYKKMQTTLVPFESRLVITAVRAIGVKAYLEQPDSPIPIEKRPSFYLLKGTEYIPFQLQWNCLGWQSILLLFLSFVVGLSGNFSTLSKLECVLIGLLGTFLINVLRMVFITVGAYYINTVFAFLIHDYFAAFVTIIWLAFFWWFSYAFVLEPSGQAV